MNLNDYIPRQPSPDALYAAFVEWAQRRGYTLYPHQDEALIELVSGSNVIVSTPTGSGKSMIALAAHFVALAQDRVSFYTAPIKALVSEKFFDLCDVFGADNVGMVTGDASVNADAPIICCTAEVLANIALREGAAADVGCVIADEFHYYAEPDRGWAWQVPLLELPQAQFVLMSATLGEVNMFADDLSKRTGRETATITGTQRPVPLDFEWSEEPLGELLQQLVQTDRAPVYVVYSSQAAALEGASALLGVTLCSRTERDQIAERIGDFRFAAGFGRTLSRLVRQGIGVHHAGLLPKYRRLVEQLAQAGLLKIICGTDTLGVGINVPIRTVVLTALTKFDGTKMLLLRAREFHQIVGRAGRAGFDTQGWVITQAPEHVIENKRAVFKAGDDPKKQRRIVKKKPPEGQISWTEETMQRLIAAPPEPLQPRLKVSHSILINLLARRGNPVAHTHRLLSDNHHDAAAQRRFRKHAVVLARELLNSGVVERLPTTGDDGRRYRLTVELPPNFAVNNALAPFALAVLETLDPASVDYHLDVVSVFEAILESPQQVLWAQQRIARDAAIAQLKADGVEYDERMELIEQVTWPQPLAALLEVTLHAYRQTHPWIDPESLTPKSIVREMYQSAMTFAEFVQRYGLARSEGVLLRYLTDAYRTLRSSVPDRFVDPELADLVEWLGESIRQTDSSLLDEWEQLVHPDPTQPESAPRPPQRFTSNRRALMVSVRNAMWRRVELVARDDVDELAALEQRAAALTEPPQPVAMTADAWDQALSAYYAEHDDVGIDAAARAPAQLQITELDDHWQLRQVLADPDGNHDWAINARLDLAMSDEVGAAVIMATSMTRLD